MTQFHGTINGEPLSEKVKEARRKEFDAFPVHVYEGHTKDGMKLRDYFAAKAMQGPFADIYGFTNEELAKAAYELADAMMKAREL